MSLNCLLDGVVYYFFGLFFWSLEVVNLYVVVIVVGWVEVSDVLGWNF